MNALGGDQDPLGRRARIRPEPPEREACQRPKREVVKIAMPAQEVKTLRGILSIAFFVRPRGCFGPFSLGGVGVLRSGFL